MWTGEQGMGELQAAAARIQPYIHRTPVLTSAYMDALTGRRIHFKCENFQKTGSFKARGALNAVLRLKEEKPECKGVVTHSSGNHAQALAYAASVAGLPCAVVVTTATPQVKLDAIAGYGAKLHPCQPSPIARQTMCDRIAEEQGLEYISSHNHPDVICGQATATLEMLDEVPELDAVFMSVCGGGLSAGTCLATKHRRPECKVFIVEPVGKGLGERLESGDRAGPADAPYLDTLADGCRLPWIGDKCFPILRQMAQRQVFSIGDEQIISAMRDVWMRMKLVVEPSAAISVAAVCTQQFKQLGDDVRNVGVLLCGGNVDLDNLPW